MAKEFNPFLLIPDPATYQDIPVQALLDQIKSPYGKAVMVDIATRPTGTTDAQRLVNRELYATVFNPPEGFDRAEWSSKLRADGYKTLAEFYEHGATANQETAIIPTEEVGRTQPDQSEPAKTQFAYLIEHLPSREMAREFHKHLNVIVGRDADTTSKLEVAESYLHRINFSDKGGFRDDAERLTAARETLTEMADIAGQMKEVDFSKEDIYEQRAASGNSEYILNATGKTDREFERIDEGLTELEAGEQDIVTAEAGRESAFKEIGGVEDLTAFANIEEAEERYQEEDLDLVREGAVFNTSAIRIGGLDQVATLPGNSHILTDKYLVTAAMPRMVESLQNGVSREEIMAGARNLEQFAGRYVEQQTAVERILNTEQGQSLRKSYESLRKGSLSPQATEQLGQQITTSLPTKEAALLLEHSAYITGQDKLDLTPHLEQLGRAEYQKVVEAVRENSFNPTQLKELGSDGFVTRAAGNYVHRSVEIAQRMNAPGSEHSAFREAWSDRLKAGAQGMTPAQELSFAEKIISHDNLNARDKELLLAPNPHWENSRAGQSNIEQLVKDYHQAGGGDLKVRDNPGLESFIAKENARQYGIGRAHV